MEKMGCGLDESRDVIHRIVFQENFQPIENASLAWTLCYP